MEERYLVYPTKGSTIKYAVREYRGLYLDIARMGGLGNAQIEMVLFCEG